MNIKELAAHCEKAWGQFKIIDDLEQVIKARFPVES
jgi:hypothetical protein